MDTAIGYNEIIFRVTNIDTDEIEAMGTWTTIILPGITVREINDILLKKIDKKNIVIEWVIARR